MAPRHLTGITGKN